jgi:hypothetical protein
LAKICPFPPLNAYAASCKNIAVERKDEKADKKAYKKSFNQIVTHKFLLL